MSLALASRRMIFNRSLRHHTLRADALLPFFDAIFAVALTLLAFNVPEVLHADASHNHLFRSIFAYCLTGLIVILYWFKLRRLIGVSRFLHVPQLLCLGQAILTICLFPKMANLVLLYGSQVGSISKRTYLVRLLVSYERTASISCSPTRTLIAIKTNVPVCVAVFVTIPCIQL
jgi:uncharacterized membrane protein